MLLGGGGREHSIGLSIVKSGQELYTLSSNSNPGLKRISKRILIGKETSSETVLNAAMKINPDLIFVGPESPLANGVTDILIAHNFKVFAPTSKAAKLETSKTFLRSLMNEKRIDGNIDSVSFGDAVSASKFIDSLDYEFVIKPDGLTGGKGVLVQGFHFYTKEEGKNLVKKNFEQGITKILIEKKEKGEEFSLQALVNGREILYFPIVQDYKRARENDEGPNTGGMGSICFSNKGLPFIPQSHVEKAKTILRDIIIAMSDDGIDYVGPIYGQFIATREGPKVVEINARFGDPEAINVLSIMNNSLLESAFLMMEGEKVELDFRDRVNVLTYIVPLGYGENPKPSKILIDEKQFFKKGLKLYYASVYTKGKFLIQTRSRSVAILSEGISIEEAYSKLDGIEKFIKGDYYIRKDIGDPNITRKKSEYMESLLKGA